MLESNKHWKSGWAEKGQLETNTSDDQPLNEPQHQLVRAPNERFVHSWLLGKLQAGILSLTTLTLNLQRPRHFRSYCFNFWKRPTKKILRISFLGKRTAELYIADREAFERLVMPRYVYALVGSFN